MQLAPLVAAGNPWLCAGGVVTTLAPSRLRSPACVLAACPACRREPDHYAPLGVPNSCLPQVQRGVALEERQQQIARHILSGEPEEELQQGPPGGTGERRRQLPAAVSPSKGLRHAPVHAQGRPSTRRGRSAAAHGVSEPGSAAFPTLGRTAEVPADTHGGAEWVNVGSSTAGLRHEVRQQLEGSQRRRKPQQAPSAFGKRAHRVPRRSPGYVRVYMADT